MQNKKLLLKKYLFPTALWLLFEAIAVTLWLMLDNIFYLFNFSYIGICLALGIAFYIRKLKYARTIVQFAVGLYMLVYLGIISRENMQIEGFWYYLFLGVFEAAVIHYVVAKIAGPLLFGRGWCGYACWTAMLLDLLPYKVPRHPRKKIGFIRYAVFACSFLFIGALFVLQLPNIEKIMFWSFIIGNVLYYALGIGLAFALQDNRAFCKYICPITVFLKPASYYTLLRVKNDMDKCISCGKCKKVCPMDVDVVNNSRKRINGTECILCFKCIDECPSKSLHL
ncbi:4Fe-4S binding protein [Anaeromassilibacillus senegalensis]|uniref:4Fe-4S binding protein n=1 Tax=Anaeromassilibacillus senegalensis TaxID=1673717 RepID=UPI000B2AD1CB|nr:4Fe-4S dicluster domain-containing protein [Anaeromassilibacillus senegalensis]